MSRTEVYVAAGNARGAGGNLALDAVLASLAPSGLAVVVALPRSSRPAPGDPNLRHRPIGPLRAVVEELVGFSAAKDCIYIGMSDRLPLFRRPRLSILVAQNPHLYGRRTAKLALARRLRIPLLRLWARRSLPRADWVVTATSATKSDILGAVSLPAARVVVRPIPPQSITTVKTEHRPDLGRLVLVGDVYAYKCFDETVRAVDEWARETGTELELVHIGAGVESGPMLALAHAARECRHIRVDLLGPLCHQATLEHLAMADLFLFPSERESYGLPLAEALAIGVPVVCRDIPQFREVAGPAAEYFSPDAVPLAAALESCRPSDVRERMGALGRSRVVANVGWDVLTPPAGRPSPLLRR